MENKHENDVLALKLGKVAKMYENGYSIVEIAAKLKEPESSVRQWISMIKEYRKTK